MSWAIGIDFGTSRSAGAMGELDLRRLAPDPTTGRSVPAVMAPTVSPLEIEGNRWVPSMVLMTPEGQLVVGAAADNLAGVHPDRLERTPKRSLGTGAPLLLGGSAVDPRDAAATVIRMVVAEGRLRSGEDPRGAIITHPVRWAGVRRAALADAAKRAGLETVQLVEEPVAAAIHYASEHVELGAHVGVYDLGGGTFDTALLQRTDHGFEVIGVPGGDENIGGENFDHRLFRYFGSCIEESDASLWEQMMTSEDRKWKRAALDLIVQARRAKEALSSYTSTQVFVPVADRDIVVNRSQFEAMIIDDVERTVDLMEDTIVDAGLKVDDLAAIFLVGGSSRVPLVAQLVTERFGSRVITRDEPKGVVALGAARLAALRFLTPRRPPTGGAPAPMPSSTPAGDAGWLDVLPAPNSGDRLSGGEPASAPVASPMVSLADLPAPASVAPTLPVARPVVAPSASVSGPAVSGLAAMPAPAVAARQAQVLGAPDLASLQPPGHTAPRPPVATPAPIISAPPAPAQAPARPSLDPPTTATTPTGAGTPMSGAPAPVTIAWRVPLDDQPGQLAADLDSIVLGSRSGVVHCIDPRNGQFRWQQAIGTPAWAAPALAPDAVVVGAADGRIILLDRTTGRLRWQLPIGSTVMCSPVVVGGTVVVGNDGGHVLGLDRSTGHVRWDLPVGAAVRAGLVAVGRDVIVATTAGQVFAIDAESGRPRWGYTTGGQVLVDPAVVGDRVLVASRDGLVHGLRLADGAAVYGVRCAGAPATPVAGGGGLFGVVDERGGLRVHRADTGQMVVEATISEGQAAGLVLVPSAGPTVAVVETGGRLVALDLATRSSRFSVPTGDANRSVPVVSGGLVCVATGFGQLYGIVSP